MFRDRQDAGRQLAARLTAHAKDPLGLVLGIPRGGVIVAHEVAAALGLPLDVCVVRKLGVPGHEELAFGALAATGEPVLDTGIIRVMGVSERAAQAVISGARAEVQRREQLYRHGRTPPRRDGKRLIVVDDGIATGADMLAAVRVLRTLHPNSIMVAVPVAPPGSCEAERYGADAMVCLQTPRDFQGVGQFYQNFQQITDAQVTAMLDIAEAA
jgi:putative phosphoribosyl transferase